MTNLDPHYDWHEVTAGDGTVVDLIRGACNHLDVVPVESGGEVVSRLCLTCDAQLPVGNWT